MTERPELAAGHAEIARADAEVLVMKDMYRPVATVRTGPAYTMAVSARTAAPVVGGLWSCLVLTLLVLPAAHAMWRRRQVRVAMAVAPAAPPDLAPHPSAA